MEQPGLMGEAEPMLETPEATVPAAEELPPAVPGEAAAVPPEAPESGLRALVLFLMVRVESVLGAPLQRYTMRKQFWSVRNST